MKKFLFIATLLAASSLFFIACSNDDGGNTTTDSTPPTISIQSPANGSSYLTSIGFGLGPELSALSATANDETAIAFLDVQVKNSAGTMVLDLRVQRSIEGQTEIDIFSEFGSEDAGDYSVQFIATDLRGNVTESDVRTITYTD
jgi:hypothetical protein